MLSCGFDIFRIKIYFVKRFDIQRNLIKKQMTFTSFGDCEINNFEKWYSCKF